VENGARIGKKGVEDAIQVFGDNNMPIQHIFSPIVEKSYTVGNIVIVTVAVALIVAVAKKTCATTEVSQEGST